VARDGWRLVRDAPGAPAVLCVDFTQARARAQAGFTDLAALLPAGAAVWGTDEPTWRADPAAPGPLADALARWLAGAPAPAAGVRAVLGFCAGASLACALARHLAHGGTAPAVVLFDPTVATARTLHEQFDAALGGLAAGVAAAEVAAARAGGAADRAGEPDPARLAPRLAARYGELATAACAAQGVPAAIAAQLAERFATHLRYLALTATVPLQAPPGALAVLSAEHRLPPLGPASVLRLDVAPDDLLADPRAAEAVAPALRPEPAAP
jgi:hypothetical protein